jgi:hypothetical protein
LQNSRHRTDNALAQMSLPQELMPDTTNPESTDSEPQSSVKKRLLKASHAKDRFPNRPCY